VLLVSNWRKIVNPVIKLVYDVSMLSRKKEYLPPRITIEGYGIKRNLGSVEALLLEQQPFNIIFAILLEKTMEKGALQVVSVEPLKIEAEKLLPDSLGKLERDFIRICVEKNKKKRQEKLINLMIGKIKNLSNDMRGFSLKETVEFYRHSNNLAVEKAMFQDIQNMIKQLAEDMNELTQKVTKATNPFKDVPLFKDEPGYMKSGSGGGGGSYGGTGYRGGGCACAGCACACAGCACACAGGGR
jgi:hypothetical protein